MADDPTPQPDPDKGDPTPDDNPNLGDPGKRALDAERKARRDAEKALHDLQARLKEIEDKDKSETDKLREQVEMLTKQANDAASQAIRAEIALSKGLSAAQAKRLVGTTREELEADADEILEAFPTKAGATPPPSDKPTSTLRGGADPGTEPVNVKALVDSIPPTA